MGQEQFLIQRLLHGEVGIRPGVQRLDLFQPGIAGRQGKDGGLFQLTQTANNCHSRNIRNMKIQDDQHIVESAIKAEHVSAGFRIMKV